jgi:hypothetical protein
MDNPDPIIRRLIWRDRLFALKAAGMFVFGIPLSLVGPFVISVIFWLAYLLFFECIGVARDGSKVWLLSQARKTLRI